MNAADTPKQRRRWWRIAAWVMSSLFTLLVLTLAGAAWWLWGWKWNSNLNFHESWSSEERAALTDFNAYMRNQFSSEMEQVMNGTAATVEKLNEEMPIGEFPAPPSGLAAKVASEIMLRLQVAPIAAALQEVAKSGKGEPAKKTDGVATPAIFAAQTAHLSALKALIAHGADPNTIQTTDNEGKRIEAETPLTPLLSGAFINGRTLPWEERREELEYMLQHGANLNGTKNIISASLTVALMMHDDTQPWQWAMERGKHVSTDDFNLLISCYNSGTSLVEYILLNKLIDVNDTSGDETPLQHLAAHMAYEDVEELEKGRHEQELDMLLAAGANPSLTTKFTRQTPLQLLESRTNFEREDGMPENSCCTVGPDIRTRWQNICDKVRSASLNTSTPTPATDTNTESDDDDSDNADEEEEEEEEEEGDSDEEEEEIEIEIS